MSNIGKLLRGLKWYKFTSAFDRKDYGAFGDLFLPDDILDDPHKMDEVNFYLDFVKDKDKDKVGKILMKYRLIDLSNPKNKEGKMLQVAKELETLDVSEDTNSEEEKPGEE